MKFLCQCVWFVLCICRETLQCLPVRKLCYIHYNSQKVSKVEGFLKISIKYFNEKFSTYFEQTMNTIVMQSCCRTLRVDCRVGCLRTFWIEAIIRKALVSLEIKIRTCDCGTMLPNNIRRLQFLGFITWYTDSIF